MAFPSDIILNDSGSVARTFRLTRYLPNGSTRSDSSRGLTDPRILSIQHTTNVIRPTDGRQIVNDRHLIQFVDTQVDTLGVPWNQVLNCTFSVPRVSVVTSAGTSNLSALLRNFLAATGYLDQDRKSVV